MKMQNQAVVMTTQPWEYAKNHWLVHFKMMTFMAHVLYLNEVVIENWSIISHLFRGEIFYIPVKKFFIYVRS